MSDLVTLSRSDDKLKTYFEGTFSKEKKAIPQYFETQSMTFRIYENHEIERPSWLEKTTLLLRPQYLIYSMAPVLLVTLMLIEKKIELSITLWTASFFGVLFLHIASILFKEYGDHMSGRDHFDWRGSQVIQRGWVRAIDVKRAAKFMFVCAIFLGLPALIDSPYETLLIGAMGCCLAFLFSLSRSLVPGLRELAVFLLSGPLAAIGFSWVLTGYIDQEIIFLGFCLGFFSVFVYLLKGFEEIMMHSKSNHQSLVSSLGFDRARRLLLALPVVFTMALSGIGFTQELEMKWLAVALVMMVPVVRTVGKIFKVSSCISSKLGEIRKSGLFLQYIFTSLVALVYLFSIMH